MPNWSIVLKLRANISVIGGFYYFLIIGLDIFLNKFPKALHVIFFLRCMEYLPDSDILLPVSVLEILVDK